jgi:hypothetical protein
MIYPAVSAARASSDAPVFFQEIFAAADTGVLPDALKKIAAKLRAELGK